MFEYEMFHYLIIFNIMFEYEMFHYSGLREIANVCLLLFIMFLIVYDLINIIFN